MTGIKLLKKIQIKKVVFLLHLKKSINYRMKGVFFYVHLEQTVYIRGEMGELQHNKKKIELCSQVKQLQYF